MTLTEMLRALVEGKKIRNTEWGDDDYVYLKENKIIDEEGDELDIHYITNPAPMRLYEKPRKTKKVKMYRAVTPYYTDSKDIFIPSWRENKDELANQALGPIEEREFEIWDDE